MSRTKVLERSSDDMRDAVDIAGVAMLDLAKEWAENKVHSYQFVCRAEGIVRDAIRSADAVRARSGVVEVK